jgi:O-antigen/teichoic acid export membrane protein
MAASSASVPAGVGPSTNSVEQVHGQPAVTDGAQPPATIASSVSDGETTESSAAAVPTEALPAGAVRSFKRSHILRGSAVVFAGYGASQVLRPVSSIVLTRLLSSDAYGLIRLANVFLEGLANFTAVGSGPAIIRDPRGDDPAFLNTAWTLQAVRGIALWLLACVLGIPYAWFYHQPILYVLIPVVGVTVILDSFDAVSMHWCQRHMKLGGLTLLEFLRQFAGLLVTIDFALMMPNVWAFPAGAIAGCAVVLVLSHLILPGPKSRFHFEREAARTQFHFGKWIFANSALNFTARQLDVLLLAKRMSIGTVGVYGTAINLAEPVASLNERLSRQILFPMFSSTFREKPQDLSRVFYRMRLVMDAVHLPALGVVMVAGSGIVKLLLGQGFWGAGWILQILCVRTAMRCLFNPLSNCCVAIDETRSIAFSHVLRMIWVVAGVPIGWHYWQLPGVVWAVALSETPVLVVLYVTLFRANVIRFVRELPMLGMIGAGCAMGFVLARFLP